MFFLISTPTSEGRCCRLGQLHRQPPKAQTLEGHSTDPLRVTVSYKLVVLKQKCKSKENIIVNLLQLKLDTGYKIFFPMRALVEW